MLFKANELYYLWAGQQWSFVLLSLTELTVTRIDLIITHLILQDFQYVSFKHNMCTFPSPGFTALSGWVYVRSSLNNCMTNLKKFGWKRKKCNAWLGEWMLGDVVWWLWLSPHTLGFLLKLKIVFNFILLTASVVLGCLSYLSLWWTGMLFKLSSTSYPMTAHKSPALLKRGSHSELPINCTLNLKMVCKLLKAPYSPLPTKCYLSPNLGTNLLLSDGFMQPLMFLGQCLLYHIWPQINK